MTLSHIYHKQNNICTNTKNKLPQLFFSLAPMLSYFTVSALEGGRSVLLEWELAYDGGHQLTEFTVEVS